MNSQEIKLLMDYVKKRYDDVSMDFKMFSQDIDTDLTPDAKRRVLHLSLDKPIVFW